MLLQSLQQACFTSALLLVTSLLDSLEGDHRKGESHGEDHPYIDNIDVDSCAPRRVSSSRSLFSHPPGSCPALGGALFALLLSFPKMPDQNCSQDHSPACDVSARRSLLSGLLLPRP